MHLIAIWRRWAYLVCAMFSRDRKAGGARLVVVSVVASQVSTVAVMAAPPGHWCRRRTSRSGVWTGWPVQFLVIGCRACMWPVGVCAAAGGRVDSGGWWRCRTCF